MIISGSASQKLAANVAKELGDCLCPIETKKFPDGERYIQIKGKIDKENVIVQSTGYPQDENLIELLFLIQNLKDLGSEKIKVVIPYFGYGRQEKRFKEGEAISAQIVAKLIEKSGADEIFSINIHEDSVKNFFTIPLKNISAIKVIAEYIEEITDDPIIIAPDKGALSFAEEIAEILNCKCTYMNKIRLGPDKVETKIANIKCDFAQNNPKLNKCISKEKKIDIESVDGKELVIIDDIIATGGTIVSAIGILKEKGAKSINVCCIHPLLVNDAALKIYTAGAESIAGTNSLKSEFSCISLAKIIAEALQLKN